MRDTTVQYIYISMHVYIFVCVYVCISSQHSENRLKYASFPSFDVNAVMTTDNIAKQMEAFYE